MRSLYLRIWLTVVAALALFALVSGWLVQRHLAHERERMESALQDRMAAWGELLQRSLPPADAPADQQAAAFLDWSQRLRVPMALDAADGSRIVATDRFARRESDDGGSPRRTLPVRLSDGRTLWVMGPRPMRARLGGPPEAAGVDPPPRFGRPGPLVGVDLPGVWLLALLALLFAAVAAGAWPVVRRLTRRLEALKQGVEAFGAGDLQQRVRADGHDEVAALAHSFNHAAGRIEALLRSQRSLLANASHELRSPLARLKMAVAMLDGSTDAERTRLQAEIGTNIGELDALVEEVLLASRLDAPTDALMREPVDLPVLLAEEAARVDAEVDVSADTRALTVSGDERLLRRALRNLLENARRYGGSGIEAKLQVEPDRGHARILVCDRGPGVPEALRERIFEPFFRLPGHAEQAGGVGLGLSLVRQIAQRHGGTVDCAPRDGGGSCFTLRLPQTGADGAGSVPNLRERPASTVRPP
ncbi:MAG: ATP-binding protein [Rubrivivax sp.]|nr:ATP-binding protein [Rubrivivax sp.]MDH5338583.1 ATP-binding protein [Rubrivivax sp.]